MSNAQRSAQQVEAILMDHEGYTERVWAQCACGAKHELTRTHGPMDYETPHITDEEVDASAYAAGWGKVEGRWKCPNHMPRQ